MRIVHVIDTLDPAHGGPQVVAENLAIAQSALGQEVRLAAEFIAKSCGVPAIVLPRHKARHFFCQPLAALKQLVESADVLHLHGVWEPVLTAAARAARAIGRPYVVTPHGLLDPWSLAQKKWKKKLALVCGVRQMLNGAAALHTLNRDEQHLIAPLKLRPRAEVIPNGVSLDDWTSEAGLFRAQVPGLGKRPFILFLGRLHAKKGLDILVAAFSSIASKNPDIDLVIAGPDGGEGNRLQNWLQRANLTSRVWVIGPLYGSVKWSALAAATVFCLPSRQEGFSVAILEALASRLPVVISDQCHFPEVAEVGAGRVAPLNAEAITENVEFVIGHPIEASQMGIAGRKLVEARFTWPMVAEQSVKLYDRLVQGSDKLLEVNREPL